MTYKQLADVYGEMILNIKQTKHEVELAKCIIGDMAYDIYDLKMSSPTEDDMDNLRNEINAKAKIHMENADKLESELHVLSGNDSRLEEMIGNTIIENFYVYKALEQLSQEEFANEQILPDTYKMIEEFASKANELDARYWSLVDGNEPSCREDLVLPDKIPEIENIKSKLKNGHEHQRESEEKLERVSVKDKINKYHEQGKHNVIEQKTVSYESMEQLQELNKLLSQMNQMQGVQTINMVHSYFQIMQAQYNSINQELKNINEKLNNMQYPQTPQKRMQHNRLKELASTLNQSVEKIPVQISQMKQDICQKATGVINDFKARGVLALNNIAGKLGIKDMLINTKAKFDVEAEKIQKTIDKFNALDNEINEVKIHTKNIGNIISEKELSEASKQEKGLFTPFKNICEKTMQFYISNSEKAHNMIVNLEKLEIDALNVGDHVREQNQIKSIKSAKSSILGKLNHNKEKLHANGTECKDNSDRLLPDKQLENRGTER